jgi:hypothetical protein
LTTESYDGRNAAIAAGNSHRESELRTMKYLNNFLPDTDRWVFLSTLSYIDRIRDLRLIEKSAEENVNRIKNQSGTEASESYREESILLAVRREIGKLDQAAFLSEFPFQ